MTRAWLLLVSFSSSFFLLTCARPAQSVPPLPAAPSHVLFADGFERELYPADHSGWHKSHVDSDNSLTVSREQIRDGSQALLASCRPGGGASKAEIQHEGLHIGRGQLTRLEWSLYVDADPGVGPLFLADLEDTSFPKSPGIRVYLQDDDALAVELKGYGGGTLKQSKGKHVPLPTRRWVDLAWTILPDPDQGTVWVEQDGVVVLAGSLQTLPSVGDQVLDRLGIGCTANAGRRPVRVFIDRVRLLGQ